MHTLFLVFQVMGPGTLHRVAVGSILGQRLPLKKSGGFFAFLRPFSEGGVEPELNPEYTGRALSRTLTALSPESKEWALYIRVDRAYL